MINTVINTVVISLTLVVAFFLLIEYKKMTRVATKPELIFSLFLAEKYIVIGRLKNIGKGIAYNIEVKSDKDFNILHDPPISNAFEEVGCLAPEQHFDITYGRINIKNEIMEFQNHTLEIFWTDTEKKSEKGNRAKFFLSKTYFKNTPRTSDLSHVVDAIEDLKEEIAKLGGNK